MSNRMTIRRPGDQPETGSKINVFELARVLLHRKRIIVGTVAASMLITATIMLIISNKYTSTATILPSGQQDKMADLKSLAGLAGAGATGENSSELFPVILESQTVRNAVLAGEYEFEHDSRSRSIRLKDYFGLDNPDELMSALAEITSVSQDRNTGVIRIGIETEFPGLSQAVLREYIHELESFNLHKRRSQASERADYLKRELAQHKEALASIEDSLAAFQSSNRDWMSSTDPSLAIEIARLEREVQARTQTYMYLMKEYEVAKLDARKDVPIVQILDKPSLPATKSAPKRSMIVLLVGSMAFILVIFSILVVEALTRTGQTAEQESFHSLKQEFTQEFPRINRLVKRVSEKSKG